MTTEQKKALLADVSNASRALDKVLDDGPHDLSQLPTFPSASVKILYDSGLTAQAGLSILEALLISEIGTDNL